MAKERRKCRPIYEDLRPLLSLISLYGVTWKSERGTGWRLLKLLSCVMWSIVYFGLALFSIATSCYELKHLREEGGSKRHASQANILVVLLGVNAVLFVVCLTRRQHLDTLVRLFKQPHFNETEAEVSVGRWRKRVRVASAYLYAISPLCLLTAFTVTADLTRNGGATFWSVVGHPVELMLFLARTTMVTLVLMAFVFIFAPAFLVCSLSYYVSATCEDSLQQLRRCESPGRKARMSGRVLRKYARLNEMVAAIDGIGAVSMYVFKMATVTVFLQTAFNALSLMSSEITVETNGMAIYALVTVYFGFGTTYLVIYCGFVALAHSANNQVARLSKTLAEVWRKDDPGVTYTDRHLHLHLLQMRVDQLIALTHLLIDRPAFTLLGEPVDGQNFFTLCTDIVDSSNSAISRMKKAI